LQVQDRRQWERIEHVRRLAEQCNDTRMRVLQGDLT
jgi:3-methyladenine DNA glycosylase AlkC